jgi:hypothetical protein
MPLRRGRRTRGAPNISRLSEMPGLSKMPEQSKIPHLLPQSEESEYYESIHKDSAEHERISKTPNMSKMPNVIEIPNMSKTASKSRDTNMANASSTAGIAGKLPRIEDGLNQLKPANFKCELLNYDNVKTWKT